MKKIIASLSFLALLVMGSPAYAGPPLTQPVFIYAFNNSLQNVPSATLVAFTTTATSNRAQFNGAGTIATVEFEGKYEVNFSIQGDTDDESYLIQVNSLGVNGGIFQNQNLDSVGWVVPVGSKAIVTVPTNGTISVLRNGAGASNISRSRIAITRVGIGPNEP